VLATARARSGSRPWWLAACRALAPGERLWIYFSSPLQYVAAMAEVDEEPYVIDGDPEYPWRFGATLHRDATIALNRAPVPLSRLTNQHPQGVFRATADDIAILTRAASL
jgi:hypothetical protein